MGYRSEVAVKCQKKAFEMFKEAYSKAEYTPDKVIENDGEYLIYFDWIKWYDDYDIVHNFNDVMAELDDSGDNDEVYEQELGYKFIRLGEDGSDTEERENCYDIELWITRKIDFDDFEACGKKIA